jgi:hypothetical protein
MGRGYGSGVSCETDRDCRSDTTAVRKAIFGLTEAAAVLLALAQFLPLFHTHVSSTAAAVGSGTVGGAHAWGVLLVALLAAFLGGSVLAGSGRFGLLLVGLLGAIVLLIALSHDLPDAHAHGLRLVAGRYDTATNVIGIGLYVEIAGALLLMLTAAVGFLFGGEAMTPAPRPAPGPRRRSRAEPIQPRSQRRQSS